MAVLRDAATPLLSPSPCLLTEAVCTSGCYALHWAAGNNQLDVLHYLLRDPTGSTVLRRSSRSPIQPQLHRSSTSQAKNSDCDGSPSCHSADHDDRFPHQQPRPYFDVNARAVGPSRGRTALHYAARNGCLDAVQLLVETYGADPNPRAKQSVTPFQMAVWRNHLHVCQYLVNHCGVDPTQVNDFGCNAAHWACISPPECAGEHDGGAQLLPLLQWLRDHGVDFHTPQRQGHTAWHTRHRRWDT